MRGRFLAGIVLALAAMTAGAIPFAQSSPIAIAYDQANPQVAARPVVRAPGHSFVAEAPVKAKPAPARSTLHLGGRSLGAPFAAPDPTNAPDPTPKPDPTTTPEPIERPEATATAKPTHRPAFTPEPTAPPTPKPTPSPTPKPTPPPTPRPTASPTPAPTAPPQTSYTGRSHFWFPALDIDVDWGWYGCDYGGPAVLPRGVWRWGCGPRNNIYLLSHAASTFKKIKTAYHNGNLQVGQNVWFANAQGDVTKFEIRWIRRVTVQYLNATANEWALNDSPTPIMTLQTCDGADDQLRIIVRLIPAD